MSDRITIRDVEGMLGRYASASGRLWTRFDGSPLDLSKPVLYVYSAYGAFTVRERHPDSSESEVLGLGLMTKRELYGRLHAAACALEGYAR